MPPARPWLYALAAAASLSCSGDTSPLETAAPGVVFTYPVDGQVDVPVGARVIVTFSEPVTASALTCPDPQSGGFCLVGPSGPLAVTPVVSSDGKTVIVDNPGFAAGAPYQLFVRQAVDPEAENLPDSGPLVTFGTRNDRPRAAPPTLIAVNGGSPQDPEGFRPFFETSTIRLVFSEPLDPRTVRQAAGAVELVDASGAAVPATLVFKDIHLSIDPITDLTPGMAYQLRLGNRLLDLGGQPLTPVTVNLTPRNSKGTTGPIHQLLRTRQSGDPGTPAPRFGLPTNTIDLNKPLIGKETSSLTAATFQTELGDPQALDGPIAFTIRRGQRLRATGLDVKLGGQLPSGVSTGDIYIELLTDAGGRMYRNPHQKPGQRPENDRAPVYVDFSLDIAVYAVDAKGNAALSQTVLGVQAAGIATATEGELDIETASSMDLGLLGVTSAPSNLVLELITDAKAPVATDQTAPLLVSTFPAAGSSDLPVDSGIELLFSEPVNLDRLRAGGLALQTSGGTPVASVIESHGASVVVRPLAPFAYSTGYRVLLPDVEDLAGNKLAATGPLAFTTPTLVTTGVPLTILAAHPGPPCAVNGELQCDGGDGTDDAYGAFTLPANDTLRVAFNQPLSAASVVHGTSCNSGDVRVEQIDAVGTCQTAVPGTFMVRDRSLEFVPDAPWTPNARYRLTMISGDNTTCDAGEICGLQSAASFDPLAGNTAGNGGGGPTYVITFTGAPATPDTLVFVTATPFTDINGSGFVDAGESPRAENQAPLRVTGTGGSVSQAHFTGPDCVAGTPQTENCMYLSGAMPTSIQALQTNCSLPDGTTAPSCLPVLLSPQVMLGTSVQLNATLLGISQSPDTGTQIMRLREPPGGHIFGYIVDGGNGQPQFVVGLKVYLDAPDMSITLSNHDLHSKPLTLLLRGPVVVLGDGRIAIELSNVADVPITVNISAIGGVVTGSVDLLVPRGLMSLDLVSPAVRGALP